MERKIDVYTVETNVPIKGSHNPVPLGQLEINESILFDLDRRNSVQSIASRLKRQEGKEFTIKKVSDTEARVWRVA